MLLMQLLMPWEEASLPLILSVAKSRLRQVSWRMLAPYGITPQQYQVVINVSDHPGLSHGELASALGLDKPTATRMIQAVVAKGWVSVQPDPAHGRRLKLHLTDEGAALAQRLATFRRTLRAGIEAGLSPEERLQLRRLLERVVANLDDLEAQVLGVEVPQ